MTAFLLRKSIFIWVVLFAVFLTPEGISQWGNPLSAQTVEGNKLALCLPLTGKYKNLGGHVLDAIQMAADETQTQFVVADCSKNITTIIQNWATDPSILAILGPIGSHATKIAGQAASAAKIPLFSLSSAKDFNRHHPWVFRVRLSPEEQAAQIATFAVRDLGKKRAAILWPDTGYGIRATKSFIIAFEKAGGVVVGESGYPISITNFIDPLRGLLGQRFFARKGKGIKTNKYGYVFLKQRSRIDFDTLFIPDFHSRVSRLLSFLPLVGIQNGQNEKGKFVQLLGLSGWQGESMKLTEGTATGALYVDVFAGDAAGGRAEEFSRAFEAIYGRVPVDIEAEAFDITWMLGSKVNSITKTGDPRRALISKLPYHVEWEGVTGAIRFSPEGDPIRSLDIYRFDTDGEVTPAY